MLSLCRSVIYLLEMIHLPINIIIVSESQFNKSQQMNWNHNDAVCESGSCASFLQYRPMYIVIDADNTLSELMSVDYISHGE